MGSSLKAIYKKTFTTLQLMFRIFRGIDHKILNGFIVNINQRQNIDGIIYQVSQCLAYILNYRVFAFAVYDKEFNGGVDVWLDPGTDNLSVINFIKKDFLPHNLYCNIRHLDNPSANKEQNMLSLNLENMLSYKVLDNQTRAILYVQPGRMLLHYHSEVLDVVLKTIATAISNLIDLKKLENAALIDPLTHCYNRRALDEHIDHDLAKAERYGSDLSAVMLDIDHFKQINDTYGHKAGDAVLQAFSKSVLSAIRKGDYLARYGGEEFILVLPETKFAKAIELAERLRKITENFQINVGDKIINLTASFGVAVYKKGTDKNMLFQKADTMLYEAKKQGRNRIKPDLRLYHHVSDKSV